MKRYASIRLVAAAALLIASGGCKDDNPGTGLNGPAVLAIQNAGAEPLQISLLEPKTQTIDIRAVARSVSAENLTVTFKVDRTLVDAYNKAHDTSYELVPAEAYEFSKKEVILPRYNEVSSTAQVTLNSEKMPDGEQYLLPITIEQIKGDDAAQTSDEGNVYYILFNKRVLPPAQLLDREGWKVVHCTSEYTPGEGNPKTGWAKDVLDGNPASYWTYNFKASVGPVVYVPLYFVFDMGKPVRIIDLAKRMIQLSGAKNVEIRFTGLRAGEKLYEEVLNDEEITLPTFHPKIKIAKVREYDYDTVCQDIDELVGLGRSRDDMAIVGKMKAIVPEFKSRHSKYEVLDK